jgi:soluble lytic murein transglycosylase-like protein
MNQRTLHILFKALRIRALLALSAISLAIYPAWAEHEAQLSSFGAAQDLSVAIAEIEAVQPARYSTDLAPTNQILSQVKNQVKVRPVLDKKAQAYESLILAVSQENEVSPALIRAVIQAESKFNHQAVSSQGAVGLMQVLPSTAKSVGVSSPETPRGNVTAGARYLKSLLKQFDDDEKLALAAYNCGPDAIRRYGNQMPPFRETRNFVSTVLEYYHSQIDS